MSGTYNPTKEYQAKFTSQGQWSSLRDAPIASGYSECTQTWVRPKLQITNAVPLDEWTDLYRGVYDFEDDIDAQTCGEGTTFTLFLAGNANDDLSNNKAVLTGHDPTNGHTVADFANFEHVALTDAVDYTGLTQGAELEFTFNEAGLEYLNDGIAAGAVVLALVHESDQTDTEPTQASGFQASVCDPYNLREADSGKHPYLTLVDAPAAGGASRLHGAGINEAMKFANQTVLKRVS